MFGYKISVIDEIFLKIPLTMLHCSCINTSQ